MKLLSAPSFKQTIERVGYRPAEKSVAVRFNPLGLLSIGPLFRVREEERPEVYGMAFAGRVQIPQVLIDYETELAVEFDWYLHDRRRMRWPKVTLDFEGRSYTLHNLLPVENKGDNVWLTTIDFFTEH